MQQVLEVENYAGAAVRGGGVPVGTTSCKGGLSSVAAVPEAATAVLDGSADAAAFLDWWAAGRPFFVSFLLFISFNSLALPFP